MVYMARKEMVVDVDGELPKEQDRADIESQPCMNCQYPFNPVIPVIFVRTPQGFLWWHANTSLCPR